MYVNQHGKPSSERGTIEWEGTAEHVVWHPLYILIFDSHFIEVRHVETGRLCQIIPGHDLRCIWDGHGAGVHGVMDAEDVSHQQLGSSEAARGVAQHVFQLTPTVRSSSLRGLHA
jgi:RHO1 GDP-GTP exchange protein 1/2